MSEVTVVLQFSPSVLADGAGTVVLGKTDAPAALRVVRDHILAAAVADAMQWRTLDPVLGELRTAEAERLAKVLAYVLPDEDLAPNLSLVPGESEGE